MNCPFKAYYVRALLFKNDRKKPNLKTEKITANIDIINNFMSRLNLTKMAVISGEHVLSETQRR